MTIDRFAPSPTGRMHLGNVYAALMSWLAARSEGGRWILRIEDLDPQRSRMEYALQMEDDLRWLGLDWDEGGTESIGTCADGLRRAGKGPHGPYMQSRRHDLYAEALRRIEAMGLTYPCYCTRADIMATQAPHQSDGRIVYPGTCRPASLGGKFTAENVPNGHRRAPSTRVVVPEREIRFTDAVCGPQRVNLAEECGDFVLRRSDGAWAYQLAVVTDDALMGVNQVVRGNDLLASAAQQIYLYELLGYKPPVFAHIPLLVNEAGQRLSKRDASLSLAVLREKYSAEELTGRLAAATGLIPEYAPTRAADLVSGFRLPENPPATITMVTE